MNRIPVNVGSRDGRVTARLSAVLGKSTIDPFATRDQISCEMGSGQTMMALGVGRISRR
jgi:hypothetical protein